MSENEKKLIHLIQYSSEPATAAEVAIRAILDSLTQTLLFEAGIPDDLLEQAEIGK